MSKKYAYDDDHYNHTVERKADEADKIIRASCRSFIKRDEKQQKFMRKVARIGYIDVEIATSSYKVNPPTEPIKSDMRRKLLALIKEARVLVGINKPKKE